MARSLAEWLPNVIQNVRPWFSEEIEKGENWDLVLAETLSKSDHGIVCVTPENYEAPWLCYEAGALSKQLGRARVCPLLLGIHPGEIDGPLSRFQATAFSEGDVHRLVHTLNNGLGADRVPDAVLDKAFHRLWPPLKRKLCQIAEMRVQGSTASMRAVVKVFARYSDAPPEVAAGTYFRSGFESHTLYEIATHVASHRLNILGRKNRKLFDKDHEDFLRGLKAKIESGFDFRVLFLDPASPAAIVAMEHRDSGFADELARCCVRARDSLRAAGIDPRCHARLYRSHRSLAVVVIDDAVVFSPVHLDEDGKPKPLTKAPFAVVNACDPHGTEIRQIFEELWSTGKPMT